MRGMQNYFLETKRQLVSLGMTVSVKFKIQKFFTCSFSSQGKLLKWFSTLGYIPMTVEIQKMFSFPIAIAIISLNHDKIFNQFRALFDNICYVYLLNIIVKAVNWASELNKMLHGLVCFSS